MNIRLVDYLKQLKEDVRNGLYPDAKLSHEMTVEITVTTQSKTGAGLGFDLQVIRGDVKSNVQSQATQKVTIPIKFVTNTDKAVESAEIAEANQREFIAKAKTPKPRFSEKERV